MRFNGDVFVPLFRQVQRVREAMELYCIAADTIPGPMDNLKQAIEQTYDVTISLQIVPIDSSMLRGSIERYSKRTVINVDGELNSQWTRYVITKEMCHHLVDGDDFRTTDPTTVIETVILDDPELDKNGATAMDVQSEYLTKLAAIELLFPLTFRDKCIEEIARGKNTTYEISVYFDIPEHLVEYALTENYMKFSKATWARVEE